MYNSTRRNGDLCYYMHDGTDAFRFELTGRLSEDAARDLEPAWSTAASTIGKRRVIIDLSGVTVIGRNGHALDSVAALTNGHRIAVDLAQPAAAATVASRAHELLGDVDLLVCSAGLGYAGPFATMTSDTLAELVAVNVLSPLELVRALLPGMLDRGVGRVLLVGSVAGALELRAIVDDNDRCISWLAFKQPLQNAMWPFLRASLPSDGGPQTLVAPPLARYRSSLRSGLLRLRCQLISNDA